MKAKKCIALAVISLALSMLTACNGDSGQAGAEAETKAEETAVVSAEDTAKEEVETAVGEFQYACQTSDVDAMLDCLDPGFSQALKSGRLLLNWMSTQESADEVIMNSMLISVMNIADISVDLTTMNIGIDDIEMKEDMATINGSLDLESSTGTYHDNITMRMAKDNDKWYITGVTN